MVQREKPTARKWDFRAAVLYNRRIGARNYTLGLNLPAEASEAFTSFQPGQFVEVDLSQTALPPAETIPDDLADKACRQILLRRPFSFANLETVPDGLHAELIYCVVGPATLRMTSLREGDGLQVLGPLGRGFTLASSKRHALLVAGGMGAPPIQHLARVLVRDHPAIKPIGFAGAKTADDLPFETPPPRTDEFAAFGIRWSTATDDGSLGHHGFVSECLSRWLTANPKHDRRAIAIFACGPEPMLAKVAQIAQAHGIDCQVSMERRMACGFGVCLGCAVECTAGDGRETTYRLCCQDGPVFDAREVLFER